MENYHQTEIHTSLEVTNHKVDKVIDEGRTHFMFLFVCSSILIAFSLVGFFYYLISLGNQRQILEKLDEVETTIVNDQFRQLQQGVSKETPKVNSKCKSFLMFTECETSVE